MGSVADVPVNVSPWAAEHITEWGLQREFDQIVEHLKRTIPGLIHIDAMFSPGEDEPHFDQVMLVAGMWDPGIPHEKAVRDFKAWEATLTQEVRDVFPVVFYREPVNGR
jgi:hypothetical protein